MIINDPVFTSSEKIMFALRELYLSRGYRHYRMSKFEEYDLYAGNKDFLVSDNVITFTDTDGKLLALKPDVTFSIIKNTSDPEFGVQKLFYNENVYRVSKGSGTFREIMQTGAECFGDVQADDICDVLSLALESLSLLSGDTVLAVSDLDLLSAVMDRLDAGGETRKLLYAAISERNIDEISRLTANSADRESAELFMKLAALHGPATKVFPELSALLGGSLRCSLLDILAKLSSSELFDHVWIDFSVIGDVSYYNGIVFKGFLRSIPDEVLSGGQYDKLMLRCSRTSRAIGFAVYTDTLNIFTLDCRQDTAPDTVNIALPKGRLGERIYELFAAAGFDCPSILEPNRKLIFENPEKKIRFFWVKPSDVPIYVERGATDIGVAGKDILLEYAPDIYELLDLKQGKCRMAVAAPKGYEDNPERALRVATKFANIARKYYRAKGRDIDIIHLNGSIEIAPILGLSDVIVDIVETGATLKENDLEIIDTVLPISARLIANRSSFRFKNSAIKNIVASLSSIMEDNL